MKRIRVLIAEDSDSMRATLVALLGLDPRIEVVGTARNGEEIVALVKAQRPDLITMDIVMPQIDGVEATARIMAECPVRILIVTAHADDREVDLAFRAMRAGALEVVAKPQSSSPASLRTWAERVRETIVMMAEVPVVKRGRGIASSGRRVDVVGLVASTGGPVALAEILQALPVSLPFPLLVAQHITEGFTQGLIRWLTQVSRLAVREASDGAPLRAGHVYIVPDRRDCEVGPHRLLRTHVASGRYAPSGDRLLTSLATQFGSRAAGIVLSGMGDDGAAGLLAIRNAGGVTLAQSRETCAVFGMPAAAVERGATADLRSPAGLATAIAELAGRGKG